MGWAFRGGGYLGVCRGQLVPALFKGQRFSTAGERGRGAPQGPPPPRGRGSRSETQQPHPAAQHGEPRRAFVSPMARRAAPLFPQWPCDTARLEYPLRCVLGQASLQQSLNTQDCIKAINRHFKEIETQFSHQCQQWQLAGLWNVATEPASPLPLPRLREGVTLGHAPPPTNQVTTWRGRGRVPAQLSEAVPGSWVQEAVERARAEWMPHPAWRAQ